MANNSLIYLDNAASTTNSEEVLQVFINSTREFFANPSSIHSEGQRGANMLLKAHEELQKALKSKDHEAIITSGATEANNLAIKGYCIRYRKRGNHIVTTQIEHPSVLEAVKQMQHEFGFDVTYVKPNEQGIITLDSIKNAIRKDTILVSVMYVNNETGAVNPVIEIGNYLKSFPKIAFHVDAVQAFGKMLTQANIETIDLLSITGHKAHGLMGCGVLMKKNKIDLVPLLAGGGQEHGYRSGTNDLAHTRAFAKTVELAFLNREKNFKYVSTLAEKVLSYLTSHPELFEINSPLPLVNPYIINFSTLTKKASVVVEALSNNGIMVSSISACHSSKEKMSYVVKAMGKSTEIASNTIRVSFDSQNTMEEINIFIDTLDKIIHSIRDR